MTESFEKTAKQVEATKLHASDALHVMLYGGSRSGKTFISVRNIVLRSLKCKSRHVILRLRFNHVKTSIWHDTLPKVMDKCFKDVQYKPNKTDFYYEFSNGSQLWLGGLDDKARVEKILGNEYSTVYLNECSQLSWESVNIVLTRLAEKTALENKMYYDCNPPSKSHWTYRLFIEKVDPITRKKLSNPNDYSSLIMNPRDNQQNIGKSYIEKVLGSLSERDRLRFEKGQFLSDVDGALWNQDLIIQAQAKEKCEEKVTVVAIDPAVTNKENSDLTGIIVCSGNGREGNIIADYSTKASPDTWAQIVVNAYDKHCANYVVAETNQGGDLVEAIIKNKRSNIMVRKVHASKGKFSRAEPVLALYEQGKVSHFDGLGELEQELTEYVPMKSDKSPDRLDAMVWGMTELVLNYKEQRVLVL